MWLITVASPAGSPLAGVVGRIVGVIAAVAVMAPITLVNEASDGSAPLVMVFRLEQYYFVMGVRASEYQEKWMLSAQHFKLIGWVQSREVLLEFSQFRQATWTFWHPCCLVQLTGHDALSGSSFSKSFIVVPGHVTRVIAVTPGLHGDDGPGAAQLIFVFDLNNGPFSLTVYIKGTEPHIALFSAAAGGGHSDVDHVYLKTPVGVKLVIAVEFTRKGVQQLVHVPVPVQKIPHADVG